jgi:ribosomal protein L14E/L6E/L27E
MIIMGSILDQTKARATVPSAPRKATGFRAHQTDLKKNKKHHPTADLMPEYSQQKIKREWIKREECETWKQECPESTIKVEKRAHRAHRISKCVTSYSDLDRGGKREGLRLFWRMKLYSSRKFHSTCS